MTAIALPPVRDSADHANADESESSRDASADDTIVLGLGDIRAAASLPNKCWHQPDIPRCHPVEWVPRGSTERHLMVQTMCLDCDRPIFSLASTDRTSAYTAEWARVTTNWCTADELVVAVIKPVCGSEF